MLHVPKAAAAEINLDGLAIFRREGRLQLVQVIECLRERGQIVLAGASRAVGRTLLLAAVDRVA